MTFSTRTLGRLRAGTLVIFAVSMILVIGWGWLRSGGTIPGISKAGYRVTATLSDVQNLVAGSEVRAAGVLVGRVRGLQLKPDGSVHVTLQIWRSARPLHEGVQIQMRAKSALEDTYVMIADGTGKPLPDGTVLPPASERPSVRIDDVLNDLGPDTRAALGSAVRRLGAGTEGRADDVAATVAALGRLGREGHTALDVIAAQSQDLQALTAQTADLLALLDEGDGRIVRMVDSAERLTRASAAQANDLQSASTQLPGVLDRARAASAPLRSVAAALTPLVPPLRDATPDLVGIAGDLGGVTSGLRASLPPLDVALTRAPATLAGVPPVAADLRALIPQLRVSLSELNPMLAYLAPYSRDAAAAVANVADALNGVDSHGHRYLRLTAIPTEQSPSDMAVSTNVGPLDRSNAYPPPGGSARPKPSSGKASPVEKDPE